MKKTYGVFLIFLSILLFLWALLSVFGLLINLGNEIPTDAYSGGYIAGKLFVSILFGLIAYRAFKSGRAKISSNKTATDKI